MENTASTNGSESKYVYPTRGSGALRRMDNAQMQNILNTSMTLRSIQKALSETFCNYDNEIADADIVSGTIAYKGQTYSTRAIYDQVHKKSSRTYPKRIILPQLEMFEIIRNAKPVRRPDELVTHHFSVVRLFIRERYNRITSAKFDQCTIYNANDEVLVIINNDDTHFNVVRLSCPISRYLRGEPLSGSRHIQPILVYLGGDKSCKYISIGPHLASQKFNSDSPECLHVPDTDYNHSPYTNEPVTLEVWNVLKEFYGIKLK